MAPRDFGLNIKTRKIDFRKNVRMRISAPDQIVVLLQNEGSIELRCAGHHKFCCGTRHSQCRTRSNPSQRLASATVGTKYVVSRDPAAAKATVDRLHLHGLAAELRCWHSITDAACHQVLKMSCERIA